MVYIVLILGSFHT